MSKELKKLKKAVAAVEWVANCEVTLSAYAENGELVCDFVVSRFSFTNDEDFLRALPEDTLNAAGVSNLMNELLATSLKWQKEKEGLDVSVYVRISNGEFDECPNIVASSQNLDDVSTLEDFCGWWAYLLKRFNHLYKVMKFYPKFKNDCPF